MDTLSFHDFLFNKINKITNPNALTEMVYFCFSYCGRRDLNPHECNTHWILSPACLPIPALPQMLLLEYNSILTI